MNFFGNIHMNTGTCIARGDKDMFIARTIGEQYSALWSQAIKDEIMQDQRPNAGNDAAVVFGGDEQAFAGNNFWYCSNGGVWKKILKDDELAEEYNAFSRYNAEHAKQQGQISPELAHRLGISRPRKTSLGKNQLPIPQRQPVAANNKPDPASVARLQTRISALETRLARARQDENTQFLLEKVLEKLDVVD
jgi:hypothetical protein